MALFPANPYEDEVDPTPPSCADCDAPDAGVVMYRLDRKLGVRQKLYVCHDCAEQWEQSGANADDEAYERWREDEAS